MNMNMNFFFFFTFKDFKINTFYWTRTVKRQAGNWEREGYDMQQRLPAGISLSLAKQGILSTWNRVHYRALESNPSIAIRNLAINSNDSLK